jgi:hypothetical protein
LLFTGPRILLYAFLSDMFNCFLSLFVSIEVSHAYFNVFGTDDYKCKLKIIVKSKCIVKFGLHEECRWPPEAWEWTGHSSLHACRATIPSDL